MNILITGGTGSGGSYLCEYIVNNHPEYKVVATSRWHSTGHFNNISSIKDKIEVADCDLSDLSNTIRMLDKYKPVKIFNMAATANVYLGFQTPLAVLQNNIFATANLLEAVRFSCPTTIFQQCSTSEVVGTPLVAPITELHELNPSNPYAVSKLTGEKLAYCYSKSYKLSIVITRAFCYINPRRKDLFATSFAMQIARIEKGLQDVLYHGNLDSIRTIMDVREMSKAYWIASEQCDFGTPYNIGGTDPISVGEFLALLIKNAKCSINTKQDPILLRPSDITNQIPDIAKFMNKTNWKPTISLEESVKWLLDECRKDVANEI